MGTIEEGIKMQFFYQPLIYKSQIVLIQKPNIDQIQNNMIQSMDWQHSAARTTLVFNNGVSDTFVLRRKKKTYQYT